NSGLVDSCPGGGVSTHPRRVLIIRTMCESSRGGWKRSCRTSGHAAQVSIATGSSDLPHAGALHGYPGPAEPTPAKLRHCLPASRSSACAAVLRSLQAPGAAFAGRGLQRLVV